MYVWYSVWRNKNDRISSVRHMCVFILRQIFVFCHTKSCVVRTEFCQLSLGMEFFKLSVNVFCDLKREDLVCMFVVMAIFTVRFLFPCCSNCGHENIFSYLTNCVQVYGIISINWLRDSQPSLQEQHNSAWGTVTLERKLNSMWIVLTTWLSKALLFWTSWIKTSIHFLCVSGNCILLNLYLLYLLYLQSKMASVAPNLAVFINMLSVIRCRIFCLPGYYPKI